MVLKNIKICLTLVKIKKNANCYKQNNGPLKMSSKSQKRPKKKNGFSYNASEFRKEFSPADT